MDSPQKRHGGKHYLADWIVSHFPPHLHYVEPFFGAGSVLFHRDHRRDWFAGHPDCEYAGNGKPQSKHHGAGEVVNDIDGDLMNFWRVLRDADSFDRFRRRLESTPFSQAEWEESFQPGGDEVERAAKLFVRIRQSRQALGKDFATLTRKRTRGGRQAEANAWWSAIEELPAAHARLQGVVVFCDDAVKVIRSQDGPYTLYYCDPPYVHESRTVPNCYEHEMTEADHCRLLETLRAVQGKVILSGYRSALYDKMLADWRTAERTLDNKSGAGKVKQKRTEVLWMNF